MTGVDGKCRACSAPLKWAKMPSGRLNPLNATEVPPEVGKGVTAFHPKTGRGLPVTIAVIDDCAGWAEQGVTFHLSHFATCEHREQFRQPAEATA